MLKKHWFVGGIIGLIFAALIILVAYTGFGEPIGAESLVQYFSSLPMFIVLKVSSHASDLFIMTVFFLYWAVLGSFTGSALRRRTPCKIAALLVIVLLIFAHFQTRVILEDQLASAARAFGNFFIEFELLRFSFQK